MSAQTDLLRRVADEVNAIGVDGDPLIGGPAEINNHVQSIVDDPDGEVLLDVANEQVMRATVASTELARGIGPAGSTTVMALMLTGTWLDGFLLGAEYMRKRIEEGL